MLIKAGDSFNVDLFSAHCGIYAIVNKETGHAYIGESVDMLGRWRSHYQELERGRHSNKALLKDWHKYGEEAFEFKVIELYPANFLIDLEERWIMIWQPTPYNLMEPPKNMVSLVKAKLAAREQPSNVLSVQPAVNPWFVADMFEYHNQRGMPPYIREIFDRWTGLKTTQRWASENCRILPNDHDIVIAT